MDNVDVKNERLQRRKRRVRKKVFGTPERPRLTVSRSLQHIYAQLVDDTAGRTLVEASSMSKEVREPLKYGGNKAAASVVGKLLGERALAKGIKAAVFDRNGRQFHGRVKALADAVREAGLKV
ncbi:MAG TPA: 50S ribosomal protein L18 [Phycisphaerae bacterium]|nr:50S ribosomal protein L18 [Phycisphaerae bacterium]